MNFFKINDSESIDLYKVEVIKFVPEGVICFISGQPYMVHPLNTQLFLDKMAQVEKGVGLTQQYYNG